MSAPQRRALLADASLRLEAAGCASPRRDAELLLAHVLGVSPGRLPLVDEVDPVTATTYDALVARRAGRVPLQHLTGVAGFRRLTLAVGPGVFVPRPETEPFLAGWAIEHAAALEHPVVVDLCTGSGAVAAAIADEVPRAEVHAVELDPGALAWAERNLADAGVDLRAGDFATAFDDLVGQVDIVTCNPPYIPLGAWESVEAEARDHDPDLALYSGDDGLVAMRQLAHRAAELLKPGGVVGAEHADLQGESAPAVFRSTGRWADVVDHQDLSGRARFVTARLAR